MTESELLTLATRMSRVFTGNQDWHYTADYKNTVIEAKGKRVPKYSDVAGPPTIAEFIAHLKGEKGLLVIPITRAGACRWGKIDIDEYPTDPKKWAKAIKRQGLPLIVELSKSGGAHLAHYHPHSESATDMRGRLADLAAAVHAPAKCELFPKQERLADGEPGSGINLPYFGGDAESTRNYAIDADGERLTVAKWLDIIERMPAKATHAPGEVNVEAATDLLSKHWTDGQRDNLNMAVAGTLLRAGLDTDTVQQILDGSSDIVADDATRKTAEQVERDIEKDKRVPGYPKLVEYIGREEAQEFMRLCGGKPAVDPIPFEIERMPPSWVESEPPALSFAIEPLLPKKTVAVLAAEGGTGKTGFGLTAAICVATGRPFFDLPVMQGPAVYIALEENSDGLQRRVHRIVKAQIAQMMAEGLSPGRIDKFRADLTLNFYPIPGAGLELHVINTTHGEVTLAVDLIDRLIEKIPPSPVLVGIDPLARLHGTDENANHVATALVNAAERIAQKTGAAVLYQHHVGKDATKRRDKSPDAARGGSGLITAARSSIRMIQVDQAEAKYFSNVPAGLIEAGDLIEVIHNKLNDGKRSAPFFLRRQELAFERFEPELMSGIEQDSKLLRKLFHYYCAEKKQPFSLNKIETHRDEVFKPPKVARDDVKPLIQGAIDAGDILKSDSIAGGSRLMIFRLDYEDEL